MPPGVSSVAASRARAQEKGFRLDKAMWTAKQSASGFSVCFFWSVTEGLAKQQKNKNKRTRKKTKVVQGPQLPHLPDLNLASSEDDLVSVKTPIKAHQENPEENHQPSQADENDKCSARDARGRHSQQQHSQIQSQVNHTTPKVH